MKYISTRGSGEKLDSANAILKGIADDGGLFAPEDIPSIDLDFINNLTNLSYEERAKAILSLFLTDYTEEEIASCVERAYGGDKFDDVRRAPINILSDTAVLELWHGPTSAFKDMALQLLPELMSVALKKTGEKAEILILVATSGDTGKAALEGFKDAEQIKIMVFYPNGGVSDMQRLQMATQEGKNVKVVSVIGNFDDAQTGVKQIFGDEKFNAALLKQNVKLSSANSINWGRLVPQIVYYFSAYADLLKAKKINLGDKIDFSVPTGNFGDILAAYYAKLMGLPVGKLICASNANNVLTDFLKTGVYDKNRPFYKTITPSMDILISSNLERLLYHITNDAAQVKNWMEELYKTGRYDVGEKVLSKLKETFWADFTDDSGTKATIKSVYEDENTMIDPHTAVAFKAATEYKKMGGKNYTVVVSTASPYKFGRDALDAIGEKTDNLNDFEVLDLLFEKSKLSVPKGLARLKDAKILHNETVNKEQMADAVLNFVEKR
ncbi:MAG: threonine synthase [Selenomonadaceae bacterium]|nr:threonine synthase [Selenomonadaceae bacterium]MBP3723052.1 threonine synthase [Selenomonadaceae bacterium]